VHTTVLPELATGVARADTDGFGRDLRWALDSIALLVVPVSVALVALAQPFMRVVVFGEAAGRGVDLLAAGLAALSAGLVPYSAFFLATRAFFALGDSRTPALVAMASAAAGVVVMAALAPVTDGAARVAALGVGHSAAYALGAVALFVLLRRRVAVALRPSHLPLAVAVTVPLGAVMWWASEAIDARGRVVTGLVSLAIVAVAACAYVATLRGFGARLPERRPADAGRAPAGSP
jgi:putative peptidoglycan lipid II flippase